MWQTMRRPDSGPPSNLAEAGGISGLAEETLDPMVLLVEDEVVVNFFLKTLFEERGFQVVMTTTAAEALHAIQERRGFCAAVIDVGLPDQPGDQLVPLIRSSYPELPIIIATGFSEAEFGRRFQDDGRVRVIGKPFDGPHLFSALNALDEQFAA
jgi:DNA-binding response OmpR family regulator